MLNIFLFLLRIAHFSSADRTAAPGYAFSAMPFFIPNDRLEDGEAICLELIYTQVYR